MSTATGELPTSFDGDLEPGTVVGEYTIDGKLGQGAFGTVYKAVHPLIGKVVAIKVLSRKLSVDPAMVSRFVAEARAVNQIRHRHIIDIFSFGGLEDGRQYYVMEYLDGEPMDALLDRAGNLSIAEALPILRAIAKALDAAHAKGIAHRDLKPENVFLGRDDDGSVFPKLLDFGIAKLMAPEDSAKHKTGTGVPLGTPYYMSPEQCRGKDVDHRTDIYAFGILVYRTLTGQMPFDADDYMSILMKQLNEEPPRPSTHLPDLTLAIDDAILWPLAKDPAERPPDLRTAVRALESAARDAGIAIPVTAGWDAQNSPSIATLPPRRSSPIVPAMVAPTLAATSPLPKSRAPLFAALAGVAVLGVAAFLVFGRSSGESHAPADPTPAPVVAPAPAPPAPAAIAPAPTPAPAPPPAPATVIITVAGTPDGTEVLLGGAVVGSAPGPVQVPQGSAPIVLTFRADGYVTTSKTVTPDAAAALDVSLKKKPGRSPNAKSTKDDIIQVFK